jgi:GDPmannose 4,6-dehydratase
MGRRALITGVGGQDGSYLAELLLEKGYEVVGIAPRPLSEYPNLLAVGHRVTQLKADVLRRDSLARALSDAEPDEVYNLASISFVPSSWDDPVPTAQLAAVGVTALLEAIRLTDPGIRFYQASSSEIFGQPANAPQNEDTPISPVTPYGLAKAYGHFIARSYRLRYGLHASSGILFNHESPRRPPEFLPRKISLGVAKIKLGMQETLRLGNLDARRDWGWAPEYVESMWRMLQQPEGSDFVIGTGTSHSVEELASIAFEHVGLDHHEFIHLDPHLDRGTAEHRNLVADAARAREVLGWAARTGFDRLVRHLVDADLALLRSTASARPMFQP